MAANLLPVFPHATTSWISRHHMRAPAPAEHEELCLWHHAPETEPLNPTALRTGGLEVWPCNRDTGNKGRHVPSPQHRASLRLVCGIHSRLARPLACSCHPDARGANQEKDQQQGQLLCPSDHLLRTLGTHGRGRHTGVTASAAHVVPTHQGCSSSTDSKALQTHHSKNKVHGLMTSGPTLGSGSPFVLGDTGLRDS